MNIPAFSRTLSLLRVSFLRISFLTVAFWITACTPITANPQSQPEETTSVATSESTPADDAETNQATTYQNPIYPNDFPDPFILRVDDVYYAYSTNVRTVNVPTLRISGDFAEVEYLGDALPRLPDWAASGRSLTWAPAVLARGDMYILYYTARDLASDRQCIGRATSNAPEGDFVDESTGPLVCQVMLGGSIDASPFVDSDGKAYLLWKNDGNCCGRSVGLWVQPLREDGLSLEGEPVELIQRDQLWESPLIEGPAMVKNGDDYFLFYSGNWWESQNYAVSYALCESVTGPCTKPRNRPLFVFNEQVWGPGGQEFFSDRKGALWMAYHGWTAPNVGYPSGQRSLRIEPVTFADGAPVIPGPTVDPEPIP